jgi:hypothetical protein
VHLAQEDKEKTAANEGDQLNLMKSEPVGQPAAQEAAADGSEAEDADHRAGLPNAVSHGRLGQVDRHKGDDHRPAPVDQHHEGKKPGIF